MTTIGDVRLDVLRRGRVAVIESASETAHYPQINRGVFAGLDLPWLDLEYYDESELDALLSQPLEQRFAAIVLTPGAIALPGVRALLEQRTAALAQALSDGVGIVITATTLGGLDRFDLTFLPEGSQVSLVDTGMREMTGTLITDSSPDDVIGADDGRRDCSALTLAAGHAFGWTHAATLHRPGGQSETVTWRAQFGLARVIISVLPYEWIRRTAIVEQALTRTTRNRGILIVGDRTPPPWYYDLRPGQFLARLPAPGTTPGPILSNFSHLRLCPGIDWPALDGLDRSALLARLENNGTVEFPADGPGLYIPDLLRKETVSSIVLSAMTRRVRESNVDGLLLPTTNLLAACTLCDLDDSAAVTMAAWIAMHGSEAPDDQRAQARWALRAAGRRDLLDLIPEPEIEPDSLLGRLACRLDDGTLEPLDTLLAAAGDHGNSLGPLSDLDSALLAYTHARWGNPTDPQPIWETLDSDHRLRHDRNTTAINVEELCYRTAAQLLLDLHAPLTIHPEHAPATRDLIPRAATELLTQQAAAEVNAHQERQAREALARATGSARVMAGILGALTITLGLATSTLPLWLPVAQNLEPEVRLTLSAGIFVIASTIVTGTMSTDTAQLVAPAWLRTLGTLIRRFRR